MARNNEDDGYSAVISLASAVTFERGNPKESSVQTHTASHVKTCN